MTRSFKILIAVFWICLMIVSCSKSPVSTGQDLMRDGKYEEAMNEFAKAMEADPLDPDARYFHAKATLYYYDLSIIDFYQFTNNIDADSLDIRTLDYDKVNSIYKVNLIIKSDLKPIYENKTHAGFYGRRDILLDYFIANTVVSVLGFFDIFPHDGEIDDFDGALINTIQDLVNGKFDTTSLKALQAEFAKPGGEDDFNAAIDAIKENFEDSKDMIVALVTEELGADVEIDTAVFKASLDDLFGVIDQYKITRGVDDDNDWIDINNNGIMESTVWVDDNGDKRISDNQGNKLLYKTVLDSSKKGSITLPWGEWKSGDWGVDEELLDGEDNDSDGRVDEDYHF